MNGKKKWNKEIKKKELMKMPKETLVRIIRMFARDFVTIDGLWFLAAEEEFGKDIATNLDKKAWERYGGIEANRIKKVMGIGGNGIQEIINMLKFSPYIFNLEESVVEYKNDQAILRILKCPSQIKRLEFGLDEFSCKPVGMAFFTNFVQTVNPKAKVECSICPPDEHPDDLWCEWIIKL